MRKQKAPADHSKRAAIKTTDEVPSDLSPGRPLWQKGLALVVLAGLIATLIFVRLPKRREETAIARAANNATPDIAVLLREINDVGCSLVEEYPDSPDALDVMARLHYRFNESDDALKYWQQAIDLNPQFCAAYHSIGVHYLEIGKHGEAVKYFRKALELEPDSSTFSVELAQSLIADGKAEEGIEILFKDLQVHPKSMATLAMLGHAHIQIRDYPAAKQYFEQAIEIAPEYTNAYHGLLTACAALGEEELANKYAEKLKEMKERDDATHRKMLKAFDDAVSVKAIMGEIYTSAANVYLAENEPQKAESYLKKALELAPRKAAAYEVLSWLYQLQGRKEEAARTLEALANVAPDNVAAQMNYAALCAEMGWFDKAEAACRRAIALTPHYAGGYVSLAQLYIQHNRNLLEAKELAQQAVDREPLAKNFYWLAAACRVNQDQPGALAAIRRAVELDPGNSEYRRVLQLIGPQE